MADTKANVIRHFIETWQNRGDEKQDTQSFWTDLLRDIYDVENVSSYIDYEKRVKLDNTSFIDGYIAETKVLIEQKGANISLDKGQKQSDGSNLTPYGQARRYAGYLPHNEQPRWIIVCNFKEFRIHDMNRPNDEPEILLLDNLEKEYHRMMFLVDSENEQIQREMQISMDAGKIVGELYDALLHQYKNPDDEETLCSLNALCVRLVFCLYAEDAGVFGEHNMFHNYLKSVATKDVRRALIDLFEVLNTKEGDRDEYMDEDLLAFPYVNGGLFADKTVVIPRLDEHIVDLILHRASEDFDWSEISPTIFGAVFESTLNPDTRRKGGMHYTSIENIHKVIDPLFLDDLRAELAEIQAIDVLKTRHAKLRAFQDKLASLTFLDPACGSGNFLTETYLSLRRMENDVLRSLSDQISLFGDMRDTIKVSIGQFYGIEINDFAATVAQTALWIAESQMMQETMDIIHQNIDFLPLTNHANIVEANALRLDWEEVVPKEKLNYIMGNPPFVGKKEQTKEQKKELSEVFPKKSKGIGNLDYVGGWYMKAAMMMENTAIATAFVSTNSITQGEQVPILWNPLLKLNVQIIFAYRTFPWDSEASDKAHVHCVIIGMSINKKDEKRLYNNENKYTVAENISPYLIDAPSILISNRSKPICEVPKMFYGSMPIDKGNLILSEEDVKCLLDENSDNQKFIREYIGGDEIIKNKKRWCLWLQEASPRELAKSKFILNRLTLTAEFRKSSNRPQTLALAETPSLFGEIRQPDTIMIAIPKVSSERRRYIPSQFVDPSIIVNGSALIVPDATLYHFGVLSSSVHNAWMRVVAGRMKSDYQYSNTIVYNNFPWPTPTDAQRAAIEKTAQAILDARALYPNDSLADLYDEVLMPAPLRKAHQYNDQAVLAAYGITKKDPAYTSESACVAMLMKRYQDLASKQ